MREVRQVRFNAWHYSDDHLWVGLIEQLFRQLRDQPAQRSASTESVPELQAELGRAKARKARLDRQLDELDDLDPGRGWFGASEVVRRTLLAIRAAGQDAGDEARARRVRGALLFAAPAVLGIGAATLFGQQLQDLALGLPWFVAAAGVLPGIVGAVRAAWTTVGETGDELHKKLQASRTANEKELQRLEAKLTRLDPARQLDALLTEISSEDRYASHRGLIGRVGADLHRLDQQLASQTDPAVRWRIILYIDDLDRCPAERVVEVLQAVNLLMGMQLFFVVVAVDPRWLFAALDQHHRHLLTDRAGELGTSAAARALSGRALDYLDKIFQVPYALRPVGARGVAFLRDLLPEHDPTTGPTEAHARASDPQDAVQPPDMGPHPDTGDVPSPPPNDGSRADLPPPPRQRQPAAAPSRAPLAPQAPGPVSTQALAPASWVTQNLRLSVAESDFLPKLAWLLPTPRAMKKFTNLYRLLRLSVPDAEVADFCGDRRSGKGPYQAAALLLAILISDPGGTGDLFAYLTNPDTAPDDGQDVIEVLRGASAATDRQFAGEPAAHRLTAAIIALRHSGVAVHGEIASYQRWAQAVARYSFETYHLYADPETPLAVAARGIGPPADSPADSTQP